MGFCLVMLSREFRLTSEKDFARLFSKGRVFHGRGISLRVVQNGLDRSRAGFIVGTKVSKRAVVRNSLKRRMREVVRSHLSGIVSGIDMGFIARQEAVKMDFESIKTTIADLLIKAKVLNRKST